MKDGNRQRELFARSKRPVIAIEENHRLVQLTERLDWTELEERVESIRRKKLKNGAGRPPHLRPLIGAVVLMAGRRLTYREAEDQIRHYAPARYLCALTETEWTPDFTTIQDFTKLMGEEGLKLINGYAVELAVAEKLADPSVMVADTTAQEAAIPYPNEMGLMASFLKSVGLAGPKAAGALKAFTLRVQSKLKAAREKVRRYRLFAKTQAARRKVMGEMIGIVDAVQKQLSDTLETAGAATAHLKKYGKVAHAKVVHLHETMKRLLPQIRYWHRTGRVAKNKIINLHIPELYSIVRGKVGKAVEFGLSWGITRLHGGFLLATLGKDRRDVVDPRFVTRSVKDHIAQFGQAPRSFAYDRGGYSRRNVAALKALGVRDVGLAPRGRAPWPVRGQTKKTLIRERAQVEAGIGTIKSLRYGFNRPAARSAKMMGACGQRAVLGFNLNKLVRELAKRNRFALVG